MRVEDFSMIMRMVNSVNNDLAEAEGRIVEKVKGKLEIILNEMYILRNQFEEVEQPGMLEEPLNNYDWRETAEAAAAVEEDFDDGYGEDEECTVDVEQEYYRSKNKKTENKERVR